MLSEPSTSLDDRGENYSSLLQCHLILFIGKKCSNKTLQYHRYFSASHERVSLDEWSKREKLSLHAMFKKVIKKLEKQCKIVIDDENLIAETRKSLLEKVKHCIPQCKVGALYFTCNNERVLEYQFNLNQILSYFLKKNHIKSPDVCLAGHPLLQHSQDTSKEQIIPSKTEGFDIVMESKVKLTIVNREKVEFNHQGLIVDGLLLALRLLVLSPSQEKDISNFADPHIHWLFTQWIKVKPNGRIIIVLIQKDYEKLCDLLGKKTKTFEQFIMWVERTCCKYFTFPIFTVEIKMMSSTQQMKRDEILLLSSLLYLHSLAISEAIVIVSPFNAQSMLHLGNSSIVNQHKKFFTTECRSDKNHLYINNEMYTSMAKLGLILVDFSSFLDITTQELDSDETLRIEQKIALIQLDYRSNQAEFLKHIEFVQIDSWKSNGEWFSKYIGRYPFISELQKSNRSEFRAGIFQDSQQREINHILFGIICNPSVIAQFASQNDFSNHLQFYQKINEYSVSNQMNMNMESINAERKRFSPKQTEKLSKGIEGSPSGGNLMRKQISMVMPNTSPPITSTVDGKTSDIFQFPVTDMSLSFICDYFGLTKFQRGKDLESSIYDVMVKLIPEKPNCFKMYSKCTSQQVPQPGQEPIFYRQEVLMKDKKINKAVCTCPDGSQGRCKHICAGILAYISILTSRNQGDEQKLEQMILKSGELDSQEHASQMNERTLSQHSVSPHSSSNVLQASNTTLHGDIASSSNEPKKKKKTLPAWMALHSKSEEKESKKKSSKAQSELKKPKTSFFLYCDDHREQVKEELGGNVSASEVAKELGKRWKDLSTEDKQVYIDKQKELQKEYEKQKKGNTMDNSTSEPLTTTRREDNKKKEPLSQQRDENSERVSHNIAMLSEPFMKTTEDSPGKKKPQSLLPKKAPHQVVPNVLHTTLCVKKEFQNDNDDDHDDRSACSNIFFSKSGNTEIHPTTSNNNRSEFNPVLRIKSEVSSPVKNSLTNENKVTLPNQFPKAIPSPQQKRDDVEVETTPAVEDDDDDDENISIMDVFFSKKKRKNPPSPRMETARDMGVVSTRGGARHLESVSSTNKDQEDDDSLSTTTTTTTATNTNVFFSMSSKKPKKVHDQQDTTIGTDFTTTTIVQNHSSSPYYQSSSNTTTTTQMVNKLPNNNNATGNDDEEEEEDELTFQQIFFSKSTKTSSSTRQHNVAESKKPMTEKDVETVRSTTNSSGGASSTKSKQTSLKSMMDAFFDF